eukprot:gb/GECG01015086.1/.p1 GENE.gb/GECG01015086.1/~~gb/GECG01015086.1/.p1  ORF type:complete len:154 (+),score=15.38 gb/GECG01015086.1/:1-462(+)
MASILYWLTDDTYRCFCRSTEESLADIGSDGSTEILLTEYQRLDDSDGKAWNLHTFRLTGTSFNVRSFLPWANSQQVVDHGYFARRGFRHCINTISQPTSPKTVRTSDTPMFVVGLIRAIYLNQPFYFSHRQIQYQRRKLVLELVHYYSNAST